MNARITFPNRKGADGGPLTIYRVSEIHTDSASRKKVMGTAEIILPANIPDFIANNVKDLFRDDDPVIIEMGYDGEYHEEFRGYIASCAADIPVVIKCEDEMRMLAKIPVNYSAENVTLDKLLKDICKGYTVDALEGVQLGAVRFSKTTVGAVLKKLEETWKLSSFMKGKQLVCGKSYTAFTDSDTIDIHMERQMVSNALNYRNSEDIRLKIKATSILKNGSKIEFEMGEENGDQLNLTYYNIEVKAELEKLAKQDYNNRKRGGFEGKITLFGLPRYKPGDLVKLTSEIYPSRNGTYYGEGVQKHFTPGGLRQEISLGDQAA